MARAWAGLSILPWGTEVLRGPQGCAQPGACLLPDSATSSQLAGISTRQYVSGWRFISSLPAYR